MENTKEPGNSHITYEKIASAFSADANTLLPEEYIEQTLEKEEKRFENASALQISPIKFVGGNTARHCKELLRRNQPFFPLYLLLSLLTEGSMMLLLYGLMAAGYQHFFIAEKTFPQSYPFLYAGIIITGLLLYQFISRSLWLHYLSKPTDNPEKLLKKIYHHKIITGGLILLLCILSIATAYSTNWTVNFQMTILESLTLYAACGIAAGIHNLIYDSHIISFLSIGASSFHPHPKIVPAEFAHHYLTSSLQQLQGQQTTKNQALPSSEYSPEAKEILRSRQLSFRIYAVLAFIIFIFLDFLCIYQLIQVFSLPLLGFFLLSLFGTFVCLVIFLSTKILLKML